MPELFGIVDFLAHSQDFKQSFEKMRRDFQVAYKAKPRVSESSVAALGVVTSLDANEAKFSTNKTTQNLQAWIGQCPLPETADISQSLLNTSQETVAGILRDARPPYVGCVVDVEEQTCFIIGDRYRLQPIYYAITGNALIFSTRIGPLLRSGLLRWGLDEKAVLDFFAFEHVTGDCTFAKSVKMLPAATILSFRKKNTQFHTYAEISPTLNGRRHSATEVADRLYADLSESVKQSAVSSDMAIPLSGGLDSRALLGCAINQNINLRAYTFSTAENRETEIARRLSQVAEIPHAVEYIDGGFLPRWIDHAVEVTGGMVGAIHFHILTLTDRIRANNICLLDGLGGDALTGGHLGWRMIMSRSPDIAADLVYRQRATVLSTPEARKELFESDFLFATEYDPHQAVTKHFENLDGLPVWWGCHRFDLVERQQRFIQFGPHLLRPYISVQTPFYFSPLVEFMKHAPVSTLIEQRAYLQMHARYLHCFAQVEDDKRGVPVSWPQPIRFSKRVLDFTTRRLPGTLKSFLVGGSQPTTDYANWFRTSLREFLEERLVDAKSNYEGIIKSNVVEKKLAEHFAGEFDHSNLIGCLLSFNSWLHSVKTKQ